MIRDVRGRTFSFATTPSRVVSLVPSITETLFDIGAGDSVVGITDFCIFPPDLRTARVGGTKNPDVEAIRSLAPDLVHMNLEENLSRHAEAIESFAPVFVSEPKSVGDVLELLLVLGEMHGCVARAEEFRDAIVSERSAIPQRELTFACAIWKDPWMWCGGDTYVSALVGELGGVNVLGDLDRYPSRSINDVLLLEPDVVFLPDEPYPFTVEDAAAVSGTRVIGPFPGHLFTWHGTRTLEGLRFLSTALREA